MKLFLFIAIVTLSILSGIIYGLYMLGDHNESK